MNAALLPRSATFALAASLAVVLACESKRDRSGPKKTRKVRVEEPANSRFGGHLRLLSNEPQLFNPILEKTFQRANILIFEGMVGLNSKLEPVPRLANKWDISQDQQTYVFYLREGVQWSDGHPFTARDVKFTYDAVRTTKEQNVWTAYFADVSAVEVIDDATVRVKYSRPYGPALLTWTIGILPAHRFAKRELNDAELNEQPVGTGPYKLLRWEKGKRVVLEANQTWWYGRPFIDTIELLTNAAQAANTVDMLESGKVDFARVRDVNDWNSRVQVRDFLAKHEASSVMESRFRTIVWNVQRPKLAKPAVRIGLTHAMDRGRIIDEVFYRQALPLSAPFFPTMWGADPSIAPYPFDLDRAVKLLDKAGFPSHNGRRFSIDLIALNRQRSGAANEALAVFRRNLKSIGVDLRVNFLSSKRFFDRVVMRDFDAVYVGWLPEIADPDPYLLLHSSQIAYSPIHPGYANPAVDKLLEDARKTGDKAERKALYQELHAILHKEVPYTMLWSPHGNYAWSRRLAGVNPEDIGPQPRFPGIARWWLRPGPRTAAK